MYKKGGSGLVSKVKKLFSNFDVLNGVKYFVKSVVEGVRISKSEIFVVVRKKWDIFSYFIYEKVVEIYCYLKGEIFLL